MRIKVLFLSLFLAVFVPAYADLLENMTLTGNGANGLSVFDSSNEWGGEPVGPYQGQIGNNTILITCLDITATTNIGSPYTYDVTTNTESSADHTSLVDYDAAAILTQELLAAPNLTTRGILSFAVWYIFNPSSVASDGNLTAALLGNATTAGTIVFDATSALNQAQSGGYVPEFNLYYPVPVGTPTSQRYIQIVPDGGATLLLLAGVLVGLETLRRRVRA